MPTSTVIAEHVHRSKLIRDKITEGLTLRRFSKREIADTKAAARDAIAVWEGLLRDLEQ